jgi:hypothetical protein
VAVRLAKKPEYLGGDTDTPLLYSVYDLVFSKDLSAWVNFKRIEARMYELFESTGIPFDEIF